MRCTTSRSSAPADPARRPDYPSAVQWFTEAANRGLADSQYNLGILYESGRGVPASLVEAYKWYALAARSGDKDAIRRRDALREKLEPTSVNAVDTLIIKWRAQPLDPAANDPRAAVPADAQGRALTAGSARLKSQLSPARPH